MAFGIRKSIARKGIKPLPYIDQTINEKLVSDLKAELTQAFKKEIEITISTSLNQK